MLRDLMDGEIENVFINFDPHGSLATTHESQGSDMGLFGGLLGWNAADERLANSPRAIREAGIKVEIEIAPINAAHPNTYKMTVANSREAHTMTAISTGGGIIEVIEVDGAKVSMAGDYYETLLYFESDGDRLLVYLHENISADEIHILRGEAAQFVEIKSQEFLVQDTISELTRQFQDPIDQTAPACAPGFVAPQDRSPVHYLCGDVGL